MASQKQTSHWMRRGRAFFHNYIAWPSPLYLAKWVIRGYATVPFGGEILKLKERKYVGTRIMQRGEYEPGVAECLRAVVKEGDTCLDIGAHTGKYTLLLSKLTKDKGSVYAFEPDPCSLKYLRYNVRLNNTSNVTILPLAVSDTRRTLRLSAPKLGSSVSSIGAPQKHLRYDEGIQVNATTLDDWCAEHGVKPDVIKIDVEGAEAAVFAGGHHTLAQAKVVLLEFHPHKIFRDFGVPVADFWGHLFEMDKVICRPTEQQRKPCLLPVQAEEQFGSAVQFLLTTRERLDDVAKLFPNRAAQGYRGVHHQARPAT